MKKWYIVQAFSGFEKKVADTIKESAKNKDLKDKVDEVLVPLHEVTEVKRGKRVQRKKKYFPSYVLVKMEMDKELYHMIKNIQKVTGFLGPTGNPSVVSEKEIADYYEEVIKQADKKLAANWIVGDLFAVLNKKNISIARSPVSAKTYLY